MAALPAVVTAEGLPRLDVDELEQAFGQLNILGAFKYSIIDQATGNVLRYGEASSVRSMLDQVHPENGEGLAAGHPEIPDHVEVTDYDVRCFTTAMIDDAGYKQHDQLNIMMEGDAEAIAAMRAEIARLVECGRVLRAMDPIPADYRDPKYWI
jgi:hypothetical protein